MMVLGANECIEKHLSDDCVPEARCVELRVIEVAALKKSVFMGQLVCRSTDDLIAYVWQDSIYN